MEKKVWWHTSSQSREPAPPAQLALQPTSRSWNCKLRVANAVIVHWIATSSRQSRGDGVSLWLSRTNAHPENAKCELNLPLARPADTVHWQSAGLSVQGRP